MKRFNYIYSIRSMLCKYKIMQEVLIWIQIFMEKLFAKPNNTLRTESFSLMRTGNIPKIDLHLAVGYRSNKHVYNGLKLSLINFYTFKVNSWIVASPSTLKVNALFKKYVPEYKPEHFLIRIPFTGIGKPHCFQISKTGYFLATNGFYTFVVNTKVNQVSIFPRKFLEIEPKYYSSQGCFSPNGEYWYFVRYLLTDWVDMINSKRSSVRCEVGSLCLYDLKEEIITTLDYQNNIHEIACSQDGGFLVFCTLKSELPIPYPNKSYFSFPEEYKKSHLSGNIKFQEIVTVDLKTKNFWFTEIPGPTSSHIVFDEREPNVFYISAHNLVFHHLSVFIEGQASLFKLKIFDGYTEVDKSYTDSEMFRIFQHDVFNYQNETYLAVMSFINKLYILHARDMTLYKKVDVGPEINLDFSKTGNVLTEERNDIFFSVNSSEDGRYLVLGSPKSFCAYDTEEDIIISLENEKLEGMGLAHTRAYGN